MAPPRTWLHLLLLFSALPRATANTSVQSTANLPEYAALDPCAQLCFRNNCAGYLCGMLESPLGCGHGCQDPGINDCVCRSDKQSVGAAFLSSCIVSACKVGDPTINVNSGVAIYTNYCASLGYAYFSAGPVTPASPVPAPTGQPTVYVTRTVSKGITYNGLGNTGS